MASNKPPSTMGVGCTDSRVGSSLSNPIERAGRRERWMLRGDRHSYLKKADIHRLSWGRGRGAL